MLPVVNFRSKHTKNSAPAHKNAPHVHLKACIFGAHTQRKFVDKNELFNLGRRHAQVSQYYPQQESSQRRILNRANLGKICAFLAFSAVTKNYHVQNL